MIPMMHGPRMGKRVGGPLTQVTNGKKKKWVSAPQREKTEHLLRAKTITGVEPKTVTAWEGKKVVKAFDGGPGRKWHNK